MDCSLRVNGHFLICSMCVGDLAISYFPSRTIVRVSRKYPHCFFVGVLLRRLGDGIMSAGGRCNARISWSISDKTLDFFDTGVGLKAKFALRKGDEICGITGHGIRSLTQRGLLHHSSSSSGTPAVGVVTCLVVRLVGASPAKSVRGKEHVSFVSFSA